MAAVQPTAENNHYLVVILFAVLVLGGALASLITGAIFGKLDPMFAMALGTWLVVGIAGVAAYYTSD